MEKKDIQKLSFTIFGERNVDISVVCECYKLTISGSILLSQLNELSEKLGISLLLVGEPPAEDRDFCKSRISIIVPIKWKEKN